MEKELNDLIRKVKEQSDKELENISASVNEVINAGSRDEIVITRLFDRMLSLELCDASKFSDLYGKLLRYVASFSRELASQYGVMFIERNSVNDSKGNNPNTK